MTTHEAEGWLVAGLVSGSSAMLSEAKRSPTRSTRRSCSPPRPAATEVLSDLRSEIAGTDGIRDVLQVMTMRLGPEDILLAARVDVEPARSGDDLELVADDVEVRVRDSFPAVRHVFVDPTPGSPDPGP